MSRSFLDEVLDEVREKAAAAPAPEPVRRPASPSAALRKVAHVLRRRAEPALTLDVLYAVKSGAFEEPVDPGVAPTGTGPTAGLRKAAHALRVLAVDEHAETTRKAASAMRGLAALTLLRERVAR